MKFDMKNADWRPLAVGFGAQLAHLQADWMKLVSGHLSSPWAMQKGEPMSLSILPRQAQAQRQEAHLPARGSSEDVFAALKPV